MLEGLEGLNIRKVHFILRGVGGGGVGAHTTDLISPI